MQFEVSRAFYVSMDPFKRKALEHHLPNFNFVHSVTSNLCTQVVHPRVASFVELDLSLLAVAASTLEALPGLGLKWLGPSEAVDQFRAVMQNQLNLRTEAYALNRVSVYACTFESISSE